MLGFNFDSDDTSVREIPKSEANLPSDGKMLFLSKHGKRIGEVPKPLIIAGPSHHKHPITSVAAPGKQRNFARGVLGQISTGAVTTRARE